MEGLGRTEERFLECPFFKKGKIKCNYKEAYVQSKASSISGKKSFSRYIVPEKYSFLEDCPICGAKKQDIQDMYDGKKKPETKEERRKRIVSAGLPTQIEM